jgi:uncharacterized protein (DUF58 family)
MNRQAWRDFIITVFLLGIAFILALLSSIAAERRQGQLASVAAGVSLIIALLGALYIVPRLARNIRLELLRVAIRTTATVEGLLFVVFLVVMAVAAWNTGNNLLYLVLSAMLAFLIAANLIARVSVSDVSVQLRFPDHIFAGEPATLTVTMLNHKRFMPSYSLLIQAVPDSGEGDEDEPSPTGGAQEVDDKDEQKSRPHPDPERGLGRLAYFSIAPAKSSVRRRVERRFGVRGLYPITGFKVSTKFPAGFFKKWRMIDATGELVVYPKPRPLDDFYHTLPMLVGSVASRARGSGDDLYAIRRYHQSDHMRHIDWKATAKLRELMVREYTREDERRLTVVFDTARPKVHGASSNASDRSAAAGRDPDGTVARTFGEAAFEEKFERAIVMAASLANHFIMERAEVEFVTPQRTLNVPSGSGYDHLYKILRSLAILKPMGPDESCSDEPRAGSVREVVGIDSRAGSTVEGSNPRIEWRLLNEVPVLADERRFKILITSAAKGTIPASIWRSSHVVFIEDL